MIGHRKAITHTVDRTIEVDYDNAGGVACANNQLLHPTLGVIDTDRFCVAFEDQSGDDVDGYSFDMNANGSISFAASLGEVEDAAAGHVIYVNPVPGTHLISPRSLCQFDTMLQDDDFECPAVSYNTATSTILGLDTVALDTSADITSAAHHGLMHGFVGLTKNTSANLEWNNGQYFKYYYGNQPLDDDPFGAVRGDGNSGVVVGGSWTHPDSISDALSTRMVEFGTHKWVQGSATTTMGWYQFSVYEVSDVNWYTPTRTRHEFDFTTVLSGVTSNSGVNIFAIPNSPDQFLLLLNTDTAAGVGRQLWQCILDVSGTTITANTMTLLMEEDTSGDDKLSAIAQASMAGFYGDSIYGILVYMSADTVATGPRVVMTFLEGDELKIKWGTQAPLRETGSNGIDSNHMPRNILGWKDNCLLVPWGYNDVPDEAWVSPVYLTPQVSAAKTYPRHTSLYVTAMEGNSRASGSGSLTMSFAVPVESAPNRLLLYFWHAVDNTEAKCQIDTLTWNGTSLTRLTTIEHDTETNSGYEIWYLLNPDEGTYNLTPTTVNGSQPTQHGECAMMWANAKQEAPALLDHDDASSSFDGLQLSSGSTNANSMLIAGLGYRASGTAPAYEVDNGDFALTFDVANHQGAADVTEESILMFFGFNVDGTNMTLQTFADGSETNTDRLLAAMVGIRDSDQ